MCSWTIFLLLLKFRDFSSGACLVVGGAVVDYSFQPRRPFGDFRDPGLHDAKGTNYQEWRGIFAAEISILFDVLEESQRLYGFTQAHLIAEDTPDAVVS